MHWEVGELALWDTGAKGTASPMRAEALNLGALP